MYYKQPLSNHPFLEVSLKIWSEIVFPLAIGQDLNEYNYSDFLLLRYFIYQSCYTSSLTLAPDFSWSFG